LLEETTIRQPKDGITLFKDMIFNAYNKIRVITNTKNECPEIIAHDYELLLQKAESKVRDYIRVSILSCGLIRIERANAKDKFRESSAEI